MADLSRRNIWDIWENNKYDASCSLSRWGSHVEVDWRVHTDGNHTLTLKSMLIVFVLTYCILLNFHYMGDGTTHVHSDITDLHCVAKQFWRIAKLWIPRQLCKKILFRIDGDDQGVAFPFSSWKLMPSCCFVLTSKYLVALLWVQLFEFKLFCKVWK